MALKEERLDASNLGKGVLNEEIARGVAEIRQRVVDARLGAGKGKIVICLDVYVEDDGERARMSIKPSKVTLPEVKSKGQYVRFDQDNAPVVDVDEDGDLNRQLPFPKAVEGGPK